MKKISSPYDEILMNLIESLKKYFDLISFLVYGSVARDEARKDSDLDILMVVEELKDRYEAFKLFDKAEREVEGLVRKAEGDGYRIFFSPIIKSRKEASRTSPLYLDLVEDAIILYDKDGFFKKILERLKKRLEELGAERVRIGKKWYWNLKEDYEFGERIEIE
ncbi:MAG: nucleotidyltransferase domain-containing protein [Candidatus Bathyarchaeia archaeon]